MTQYPPKHPGHQLVEGFLEPMGLSAIELADGLSLALSVVESILGGERSIDADLAIRLGRFFDVPAIWWLEMQARYDIELASASKAAQTARRCEQLDDFVVTPSGARPLKRESATRPHVEMLSVPDDLLALLRAQAKLSAPRERREIEEITLNNGAQALIGRAE